MRLAVALTVIDIHFAHLAEFLWHLVLIVGLCERHVVCHFLYLSLYLVYLN